MSPVPGRSTLITSAPNQARSWVQVGPDWTWVKSRMRTPSSALPIFVPLLSVLLELIFENGLLRRLFAKRALRVEVADAAAFAARGRIDHRVDERRPS